MTDLMQVEKTNYVDELVKMNERDITLNRSNYTSETRQFIRFIEAEGTPGPGEALETYRAYLVDQYKREGMSAANANKRITAAKRAVKFLVDEMENTLPAAEINRIRKRIDETKNVAKPTITVDGEKIMSREEIKTILQNTQDPTVALVVELLANTGLRISEALGIIHKNIKANGKVKINIPGKGNKTREVMIPRDLYERINAHFKGTKYLFEHNGRDYSRNSMTQRIKLWTLKTIGREVSAHAFRHSFATYLLNEKKYDLKRVSLMLGHSSVKITADIYQSVILSSEDWEGGFLDL